MTSYLKHISILLLAASITYFSYTLSQFVTEITKTRQAIPHLVEQVSTLEQSVKLSQWLSVVDDINKKIPSVVAEVSEVNQKIPVIWALVETLQKNTVPSILSEVKVVRESVIPPVIEQVKYTNEKTVPQILAETQLIRTETIPAVLKESSEIRALTPGVLTRVESISADAEKIVSKATAGAVEGTVKGVISTPFNLIGDLGDRVIPNSEETE
ncbi:hypothetical protein [Photobacterium sp. OFAV2-7]|uniref:hypothetical protein n=1 Tax=Photobacterium sp. OFAV2-7 TaxID=2917748 RepID=UPI001EF5B426|nr:hypothetical protein [Photobacterium sp. OFAV2-7]MCG7585286.1 hypothetical protein [Photobacterium sp. OFAV2-7]